MITKKKQQTPHFWKLDQQQITHLQNLRLGLENFHWMLNFPVELSWPGYSSSHWGKISRNERLSFVLLVGFPDTFQILPIIHQNSHVLFIHVQFCSSNALKLSQKLHSFFSLKNNGIFIIQCIYAIYAISYSSLSLSLSKSCSISTDKKFFFQLG